VDLRADRPQRGHRGTAGTRHVEIGNDGERGGLGLLGAQLRRRPDRLTNQVRNSKPASVTPPPTK